MLGPGLPSHPPSLPLGSFRLSEVSCCLSPAGPPGTLARHRPLLWALLWGLSQVDQLGSTLTPPGEQGSARVHGWAGEVDAEPCRPGEDGLQRLSGPRGPELGTHCSAVNGLPSEFLGPLQRVGHLPPLPKGGWLRSDL